MANPFGVEIDNYYLDGMARYHGKAKTQEDRAREAMRVKDGVGHEDARKYVVGENNYHGNDVNTLCMIFNATGETLYHAYDHDSWGNFGRTPLPVEIGNGQWVSFMHIHNAHWKPSGSQATVIYRGKQKDGLDREFSLAWSSPFSGLYKNKAYCEMNEVGNSSSWGDLYYRTLNSSYDDKVDRDGMLVQVSTAPGFCPVFIAVLSIPYSP